MCSFLRELISYPYFTHFIETTLINIYHNLCKYVVVYGSILLFVVCAKYIVVCHLLFGQAYYSLKYIVCSIMLFVQVHCCYF